MGGLLVGSRGRQLGHIALEGRSHDPLVRAGPVGRGEVRHQIAMTVDGEGRHGRQRPCIMLGHADLAAYGLQLPFSCCQAAGLQQGLGVRAKGQHQHGGFGQGLALRIQHLPDIAHFIAHQARSSGMALPMNPGGLQQRAHQLCGAYPASLLMPYGVAVCRQLCRSQLSRQRRRTPVQAPGAVLAAGLQP